MSLACAAPTARTQDELVVFAAASLQDAMREVAPLFRERSGRRLVFNFAGSNVLAHQIDATPGADVYISADVEWVEWLETRKRLDSGSRDLWTNELVLIVPEGEPLPRSIGELATRPPEVLSIADPAGVPAGRYARECLESVKVGGTDLWSRLRGLVAPAADVRVALALVEAVPDSVGLVYRTDVAGSDRVAVARPVCPELAGRIRYRAAPILGGPGGLEASLSLLDFLAETESRDIFESHGFAPVSRWGAP